MQALPKFRMEDCVPLTTGAENKADEAFTVTIDYQVNLTRSQLIEAIARIKKPEVIFWYMGVYGLREASVNYYRKDLSKIFQTSEASCQLYDLTAWLSFSPKYQEGTLEAFNRNVDVINQFAIPRIQCLKSCAFFTWLKSLKPGKTIEDLRKILKRAAIYKMSEGFPESIQSIGDIFKKQCPLLSDIYEQNASKCYSALQYLEGIYLVQLLVKEALIKNRGSPEINLIFALPNKEYLYFQDEANSLAKDVENILQEECSEELKGKKVNLMFYCFRYGDGEGNRPYNAPSKNIDAVKSASQIMQLPKAVKEVKK